MNRRGVEVIRDRGRFAGPNAVVVGDEILEAKHIVIATGTKPRELPFPGAELMITSDDVLSERTLPVLKSRDHVHGSLSLNNLHALTFKSAQHSETNCAILRCANADLNSNRFPNTLDDQDRHVLPS